MTQVFFCSLRLLLTETEAVIFLSINTRSSLHPCLPGRMLCHYTTGAVLSDASVLITPNIVITAWRSFRGKKRHVKRRRWLLGINSPSYHVLSAFAWEGPEPKTLIKVEARASAVPSPTALRVFSVGAAYEAAERGSNTGTVGVQCLVGLEFS